MWPFTADKHVFTSLPPTSATNFYFDGFFCLPSSRFSSSILQLWTELQHWRAFMLYSYIHFFFFLICQVFFRYLFLTLFMHAVTLFTFRQNRCWAAYFPKAVLNFRFDSKKKKLKLKSFPALKPVWLLLLLDPLAPHNLGWVDFLDETVSCKGADFQSCPKYIYSAFILLIFFSLCTFTLNKGKKQASGCVRPLLLQPGSPHSQVKSSGVLNCERSLSCKSSSRTDVCFENKGSAFVPHTEIVWIYSASKIVISPPFLIEIW